MTPFGRLVRTGLVALLVALHSLADGERASARGRTLIHDTEIESTVRDFAHPLLEAAGLQPDSVQIFVIGDTDLNAFVAGGQNMFLFTGLLMRTETPGQLSGVLAHEIGHIASGHLVRTSLAANDASTAAILGIVLGTAAAAVSGRADAGAAIIQGTTSALRSSMFRYSRTQEAAADQAATQLLDATGQSSRGYVEFLEILERETVTVAGRATYATTHPLTRDRIIAAERHLARSPWTEAAPPPDQVRRHARMVAKLAGFLLEPEQVLKRYPETDRSVPARYARAIVAFTQSAVDQALDGIDSLIDDHPQDGYFRELRGQILFESGRPEDALAAYGDALRLLESTGPVPRTAIATARVELALNTPDSNRSARKRLELATRLLPYSRHAWRQLAIAQGRTGARGLAAVSLAEEALLGNRPAEALDFARRAQHLLAESTPGRLRAEDIMFDAKRRLRRH